MIRAALIVFWLSSLIYVFLVWSWFGFNIVEIYYIPLKRFSFNESKAYFDIIILYGPPLVSIMYLVVLGWVKRFRESSDST